MMTPEEEEQVKELRAAADEHRRAADDLDRQAAEVELREELRIVRAFRKALEGAEGQHLKEAARAAQIAVRGRRG